MTIEANLNIRIMELEAELQLAQAELHVAKVRIELAYTTGFGDGMERCLAKFDKTDTPTLDESRAAFLKTVED